MEDLALGRNWWTRGTVRTVPARVTVSGRRFIERPLYTCCSSTYSRSCSAWACPRAQLAAWYGNVREGAQSDRPPRGTPWKHLVLAGGDMHTSRFCADSCRPDLGHRLTVISPDRYSPYSGMLPVDCGHYDCSSATSILAGCAVELAPNWCSPGRRRRPEARTIALDNGRTINWIYCPSTRESTPDLASVPGAREHVVLPRQ